MNTTETLSVAISGQLTIGREELERLLQTARGPAGVPAVPADAAAAQWPKEASGPARLAYSTADGDDAADCLRYLLATKSRAVTQRKLRGL